MKSLNKKQRTGKNISKGIIKYHLSKGKNVNLRKKSKTSK